MWQSSANKSSTTTVTANRRIGIDNPLSLSKGLAYPYNGSSSYAQISPMESRKSKTPTRNCPATPSTSGGVVSSTSQQWNLNNTNCSTSNKSQNNITNISSSPINQVEIRKGRSAISQYLPDSRDLTTGALLSPAVASYLSKNTTLVVEGQISQRDSDNLTTRSQRNPVVVGRSITTTLMSATPTIASAMPSTPNKQSSHLSNFTSENSKKGRVGSNKKELESEVAMYKEWDSRQALNRRWEEKKINSHTLIERTTIESTEAPQFSKEPRSISRQSSQRQRDFVSQIQTLPGSATTRELREKNFTPDPRTIHPINLIIQQSYAQQTTQRERRNTTMTAINEKQNLYNQAGAQKDVANSSQANLFTKHLQNKQIAATAAVQEKQQIVSRYKEEYIMRTNEKDISWQENIFAKRSEEINSRKRNTSSYQAAAASAAAGDMRTRDSSANNRQVTPTRQKDCKSSSNTISSMLGNSSNVKENIAAGKVAEDKKKHQLSSSYQQVSSSNLGIYKSYEKAERPINENVSGRPMHPMRQALYKTSLNFLSSQ